MPSDDETILTIHGLEAYNEAVDGEVFAEKLKAFLAALAAADTAANGNRRHKFMISALEKNTATAGIREQVSVNGPPPKSSVRFYQDGLSKIEIGHPDARGLPKSFIKNVAILNRGVGKTFAFGEIKFKESVIIRIDDRMRHQAVTLLNVVERTEKNTQKFFKGYSLASFDGILKLVDLRGEMKTAYLILTAGGRQIDCDITYVDVDLVRAALDKRAIVSGMAFYRGDSGLPLRIELRAVKVLKDQEASLSRWRGAFAFDTTTIDYDWSRD